MTILDDKPTPAIPLDDDRVPSGISGISSILHATTTAARAPQRSARTGFDPQTKWWMNYFNVLTGRMTREGQFHYREARYRANEERDCKRCEEHRDWLLAFSPTVRFLNDKITALNGNLDSSNILCRRCPARLTEDGEVHRQSGGFSPAHGILICANEVRDRKHLEDTLSHEMVHAWDHLRWNVDWMGDLDLKHAACTEVPSGVSGMGNGGKLTCEKQIRASMLSGECRWTREAFTRGNWSLSQQFQDCVRKRAIQSVLNRPRCKDDVQATKVVNQVWDSCFSDTRPFDEVYR
ncbi:LOW QUALITY PROTEIN: metalloprotease atp23 [Colletotrichum tofieldiae]|nr:LOW QUALITY PROTEIN: metalloprotease atp23 [Colletotrichum tofieldiae]